MCQLLQDGWSYKFAEVIYNLGAHELQLDSGIHNVWEVDALTEVQPVDCIDVFLPQEALWACVLHALGETS